MPPFPRMNDDEVKRRMLAESVAPGLDVALPVVDEAASIREQLLGAAGERETNEQRFLKYIESVAKQSEAARAAEAPRAAAALEQAKRSDAMRSAGDLALAAGQAFVGNQGGASQAAGFSRATPETERAERANKDFQAWLGKRYDAGDLGSRFTQAMGQDVSAEQNRRVALAQALEDQRTRELTGKQIDFRAKEAEAQQGLTREQIAQRERDSRRQAAIDNRRIDVDEELKRKGLEIDETNAAVKRAAVGGGASTGRPMPADAIAQLADIRTAKAQIAELSANWDKLASGAGSSVSGLFTNSDANLYEKMLDPYTQSIGKPLEGGKMTDRDFPRYKKMMPQKSDTAAQKLAKIEALKALAEFKEKNIMETYSAAGYRVPGYGQSDAAPAPGFVSFKVGEDTFDVPPESVEKFLAKFPDAKKVE